MKTKIDKNGTQQRTQKQIDQMGQKCGLIGGILLSLTRKEKENKMRKPQKLQSTCFANDKSVETYFFVCVLQNTKAKKMKILSEQSSAGPP